MVFGKDGVDQRLGDIQVNYSWIPTTPANPDSTAKQPICYNWDGKHQVQANSMEPNNFVYHSGTAHFYENLVQETQYPAMPSCSSSVKVTKGFNTQQAGNAVNSQVHSSHIGKYDKFSIVDNKWDKLSFQNLLAVADARGTTVANDNAFARRDFVATGLGFHPHNNCRYFTNGCENSPLANQSGMQEENINGELNSFSNILMGERSIFSEQFFHRSLPSKTIANSTLIKSKLPQFEPITPEKASKAQKRQESGTQDLTIGGEYTAKDAHDNKFAGDKLTEIQMKDKHSHLCIMMSTVPLENHNPDKEGSEDAELSKTNQKPTRKKHRPKVVIEGRPKKTPKPSTNEANFVPLNTCVKRKYNRKVKVNGLANTPPERLKNEADANKEPPGKDTPPAKRKYVRKMGTEKHTILDEVTTNTTERNNVLFTRSSCRRSLNFDLVDQEKDESSLPCSSNSDMKLQAENGNAENHLRASVQCRQETEVMKKTITGVAEELTYSTNPVEKYYLSTPKENSRIPSPYTETGTQQYDHILAGPVSTRGKCQIVFSDVTHDKEANTVQMAMRPDCQWAPKSPYASTCSSITCLNPEKQARGSKRQHSYTAAKETDTRHTNVTGIYYNSINAYSSVFSQNLDKNDSTSSTHFSVASKKTRTEMGKNTASCFQSTMATVGNHVKLGRNGYPCVVQWKHDNPKTDCSGTSSSLNVQKCQLAIRPMPWMEKRRSRVSNGVHDVVSVVEAFEQETSPSTGATISSSEQGFKSLHQPITCMEALELGPHATTTKHEQSDRDIHTGSTTQSPPSACNSRNMFPFDEITEKLNQLDLNAKSSKISAQEPSAFDLHYQERHALVPYQRGGPVIPSFAQVRRRPRPKVELDDETTRVWKLLLENINSEGIDGTDEEKRKWWEEERKVFIGRADSFIARMHLVQGDRRFSPWKGSVLDSVIGVFLTQNVSDHLSSSAFMSLVARFPFKANMIPAELHKERGNTKIDKFEVHIVDLDEISGLKGKELNKKVFDEDREILQKSIKPIENSSDSSLENNLRGEVASIAKQGSVTTQKSVENKWESIIDDERINDDTISSQASMISSQNSADSPVAQTTETTIPSLHSNLEEEPTSQGIPNRLTSTCFLKLQIAGNAPSDLYEESMTMFDIYGRQNKPESLFLDLQREVKCGYDTSTNSNTSCGKSTLSVGSTQVKQDSECTDLSRGTNKIFDTSSKQGLSTEEASGLSTSSESQNTSQMSTAVSFRDGPNMYNPSIQSGNDDQIVINIRIVENQKDPVARQFQENCKIQAPNNLSRKLKNAIGGGYNTENSRAEPKEVNQNKYDYENHTSNKANVPELKGRRIGKLKQDPIDWDTLRKQAQAGGRKRERTVDTMDSVDWDAVRCADVNDIAHTIRERGMNNMLAERIKNFLNRLVRDHGSLDLEWLRDVPPDKAKEYLLSVKGLGLKSVECVRLLTLHHLAFPVDTNVGRIAVRLGWVPLQPLPESLQLHLLELYPVLESIQKYLWPRLCKLDQRTLYELHYQMITFGKVFCTKSKPNCNACPMRGECRHFASAFASSRLALPAPEEKSITSLIGNMEAYQNSPKNNISLQLPLPQANQMDSKSEVSNSQPIIEEPATPEPTIEVPATPELDIEPITTELNIEPTTPEPNIPAPTTPEPSCTQVSECGIVSIFSEDPDEIPTIQLNMEEFTHNLKKIIQQSAEMQEFDTSRALVALTPEAALIPMPKLKKVSQLRTEHLVYELPDSHPLLEGMDKREADDPCPYLLAIWTPGETINSVDPPERRCSSQEPEKLCTDGTCLSCSSLREANSLTVRGTLLIPCRTAMRGSFPLNGTYFQVNEVFSDHESSLCPMDIPREWLWNLPRRMVYFGTSIPTIFKGLSTEGIQYCFWRGFVCVRGFDRKTRAPRPLIARLHFPASKLAKDKGKTAENKMKAALAMTK